MSALPKDAFDAVRDRVKWFRGKAFALECKRKCHAVTGEEFDWSLRYKSTAEAYRKRAEMLEQWLKQQEIQK